MPNSKKCNVVIVIASGNPNKCRELRQGLEHPGVRFAGLQDFPPIVEPEETGATFADNARGKAAAYALATGHWALADDSGLVVDALGGRPGVLSARYAADRLAPGAARREIDAANNARLLEDLAGVPDEQLTARFVCHLALSDGRGVLLEASGAVEGRIVRRPAGHNGFGYDPIFYLPELCCTMAQLPSEAKNGISHRGRAVQAFAAKLRELLEGDARS